VRLDDHWLFLPCRKAKGGTHSTAERGRRVSIQTTEGVARQCFLVGDASGTWTRLRANTGAGFQQRWRFADALVPNSAVIKGLYAYPRGLRLWELMLLLDEREWCEIAAIGAPARGVFSAILQRMLARASNRNRSNLWPRLDSVSPISPNR